MRRIPGIFYFETQITFKGPRLHQIIMGPLGSENRNFAAIALNLYRFALFKEHNS